MYAQLFLVIAVILALLAASSEGFLWGGGLWGAGLYNPWLLSGWGGLGWGMGYPFIGRR